MYYLLHHIFIISGQMWMCLPECEASLCVLLKMFSVLVSMIYVKTKFWKNCILK